MLVPTPTIRKFVERPFRIIAGHEMMISVSATIISKRENSVSNPEIIFNGITGEMTSVTKEMKTDAEGMAPTFAAVTTVTTNQTIIIAKTY